jgi:hypothetical protein
MAKLTERSAKGWRWPIAQCLVRIEHVRHHLSATANHWAAGQSPWAGYARKRVAELLGWPVRIACRRGLLRVFGHAHLEALGVIGDHRVVRLDLLSELLRLPQRETEQLIRECAELGLLRDERFLAKDPCPWVWLTSVGGRAIGRLGSRKPGLGQLERCFALAKVRADLARRVPDPQYKWTADWKLRRERRPVSRAVDAVVEVHDDGHAIVVLLLAPDRHELKRSLNELCGFYSTVVCACSNRTRSLVERVSQELQFNNLVVLDAPTLVGKG